MSILRLTTSILRLIADSRALLLTGATALAAAAVPLPAASQSSAPTTALFSGVDVGPNAYFSYTGGIVVLGGDLGRDGFVLRGFAGYGRYDYVSGGGVLGEIDGRMTLLDAMLGYQVVRSNLRATGFVGIEYQNHRLSPNDPGNAVSGEELGFKVSGELSTDVARPFFFSLTGSYSTAFDNYWSRLRVGYKLHDFVVGPEGLLFGNEEFDARRFGAFVQTDFPVMGLPTRVSISGGRQIANDDGIFGSQADGGYVSLNVAVVF